MGEAKRRKALDPNWGKAKAADVGPGVRVRVSDSDFVMPSGFAMALFDGRAFSEEINRCDFACGVELDWIRLDEFRALVHEACCTSNPANPAFHSIRIAICSRMEGYSEANDSWVVDDLLGFAQDFAQGLLHLAAIKGLSALPGAAPLSDEEFEMCFLDLCSWAISDFEHKAQQGQTPREIVSTYFWNDVEATP